MMLSEILWEYRYAYISGLIVTLQLCAIAWVGGVAGGLSLAVLADQYPRAVGGTLERLVRVVEAIPILVLLFWIHYPAQASLGIVVPPFYTTAALLAFVNTLAVFGIVWSAIRRVPGEYIEAAHVCGVEPARIYWSIKIPLALRSCVGALASAQVSILHLSIFGSLISVEEIFRVAQRINALTYRPVEVYTGLALLFLALCFPLNSLATRLTRHYGS